MKVINIVVLGFAMWLVEALTFMVAVGVIRGEWLHTLPTVDFPSSMLITLGIGWFITAVRVGHEIAETARKS